MGRLLSIALLVPSVGCGRTQDKSVPSPEPRPDSSVRAKMKFEAVSGVCFGACIPHAIRIDESGVTEKVVTGATYSGVVPVCPESQKERVPDEELKKLERLALEANVTKMNASYPNVFTDHARLTTVVTVDGRPFRVEHPDELPPMGGEAAKQYAGVAQLIELNQEIQRAARAKEWLDGCKIPGADSGAPAGRR